MTLDRFLAAKGLTRAAFAAQVGITRVALQRYIAGERFPRTAVLRRITEATDGQVTANDFVAVSDARASASPVTAAKAEAA